MKAAFFSILLIILFFGCSSQTPEIAVLEPRIGVMGQLVTIRGRGFGEERNESFVTIAGIAPTSSSYVSWTDSEIVLRTPEFGDAGLVYVHRGSSRSNPALFANHLNLPTAAFEDAGTNPRITSISPSSGPIGTLITIQGRNFGSSRANSEVYFSWIFDSFSSSQENIDFIAASENDFAYEHWSEREIRVRVPDGAVSGNIEVRTLRGNTLPAFFEVTGVLGTKSFPEKRSFNISYSVDIAVERAVMPNSLFIFMPLPVTSSSQQNMTLLERSSEPFVDNYQGTTLFQFSNLSARASEQIYVSYQIDVYEVETNIRAQAPPRLNSPNLINTVYTLPSPLIPSSNDQIRARATEIIARETLLLTRAQRIYQWIITNKNIGIFSDDIYRDAIVEEVSTAEMDFSMEDPEEEPEAEDYLESSEDEALEIDLSQLVLDALNETDITSYQAALLFTALARAAGIPAIPVSGVLIDFESGITRHFWSEFYIDGFGWIPVDPSLGSGSAPPLFPLRENYGTYYFGNLDFNRITFSRAEHNLMQMTPTGRTLSRPLEFSLQNLWEEASGGLDSYFSVWSNVTILEIEDE